MSSTTSLKLPDALKATIAHIAALEGKTAHALMIDTLQSAMEDAVARQRFYAEAEEALQSTLRSNKVYRGAEVKAHIMAKVNAKKTRRPKPAPLDPRKPMVDE